MAHPVYSGEQTADPDPPRRVPIPEPALFSLLARYVPNVAKRSRPIYDISVTGLAVAFAVLYRWIMQLLIKWSSFIDNIILTTDRLATDDRPLISKISNDDICATGHPIYFMHVWFQSRVFGVGGSKGAISIWKFDRNVGENNARGVIKLVTI